LDVKKYFLNFQVVINRYNIRVNINLQMMMFNSIIDVLLHALHSDVSFDVPH